MKTNTTHSKSGLLRITLLLSILAALLLPSASMAQSSSVDGYGGSGGQVQVALSDSTSAAPSTSDSSISSLPFTGTDVGFMIGGAVVLMLAGLALGRAARRVPEPR
jgi:hypothetical protein